MASHNVAAPALTYTAVPTAGLDQAIPGGVGNVLTSKVLNETVLIHLMGWDITFGGGITLTLGLVALTVLALNGLKLCRAVSEGWRLIKRAKDLKTEESENGTENS